MHFVSSLHSLSCFLFRFFRFFVLFSFVYLFAWLQKLGTHKSHGLIHGNFCFLTVVVFPCPLNSKHCFWGIQEAENFSNLPCCAPRRPRSVDSISAGKPTATACAGVLCRHSPLLPLSLPLLLLSVHFSPAVFSFVSFLFLLARVAVREEVGA